MTLQVVKFNGWYVPFNDRVDPLTLTMRGGSVQPFRQDGGLAIYGRSRRPIQEKSHMISFKLRDTGQSVCGPFFNADASPKVQVMMEALLGGMNRLWFDGFNKSGPQLFSMADLNECIITPSRDNWADATVTIDWQVYNPILYRPLNSGYLNTAGYTPVVVSENAFGESGDERTFASFTISASPTDFTIINEGQLRTHNLIIRIESLGVNGYENPRVDNLTTEQWVEFGVTGSTASHVIQAKCSLNAHRVRQSTDGGLSFVNNPTSGNIWPQTSISDLQVPILELAPGSNSIRITADGTPNFRVMFLWLPAYGML